MSQNYVILEGKDLNTLIDEGLNRLKKDKDQVEIEVLEKGKSLMGVSIRDYKIKMSLKQPINEEIDMSKEIAKSEKLLDLISSEPYNKDYFMLKFLDDGVYLVILDWDIFYSNTRQVLDVIRKKKITDIDIKAIEEALNSTEKKEFKIAPKQEEILFDAELKIDISKDDLYAFITLIPPDGGKEMEIDSALEEISKQIKYGLDINLVRKLISERHYNNKTLVATGEVAIDGEDGYIKYLFSDKTNTTPRMLEDGSVDFRNLDIIHNVRMGDILAELIHPTSGKQGTTVRGELIKCKNGKEAIFRYGKNVKVSEDGNKLIAEKDGQVRLEDGKVVVNEVLEVKENVDNSTGNIKFNGTIKIRGNVITGFKVDSDGDVEIEGVVEGAEITSLGNIFLKRGIQGYNKGKLISKGSIVAKYIENSYLEADSDIIADAIMHSEVSSKGNIKVSGRKGLIVGGTCKAAIEIAAKTIGSTMATATILEVGAVPGQRANQEAIKSKIDETESNIEKLNKTITLFNRLSKNGELTEEKEDMLNKTIRTRNILNQNLDNLKKELAYIGMQIELLSRGRVKAENVIYPGVKIIIGNSTMFVRDEIKHCTIYREDNEIKIGPYEL